MRKKERKKIGEMSGGFVGAFKTLKKERNKSKKEIKIEENGRFELYERRKRHKKK